MESKGSAHSRKNWMVLVLPKAITIGTWIGVLMVVARSFCIGEYSDAWIVLGAILIVDAVRNFGDFAGSRGFINSKSDQMTLAIAIGAPAGVVLLWTLAKALIPKEIAGDFRIMGIIVLAFMAVSLINWVCKYKLSPKQDEQAK